MLDFHVNLFGVCLNFTSLFRSVLELHVHLFGVEPELYVSLSETCLNPTNTHSETELRAAQPRRDPRDARRLAPHCGGRLVCRAIAPYTPQSVLAALWYFAGAPCLRRENAETLVHSAFCKLNYPFTRSFSLRGRRGYDPRRNMAGVCARSCKSRRVTATSQARRIIK